MSNPTFSNWATAPGEWQRRIARAEELGAENSFATEILRFYVTIARFQEDFYRQLNSNAKTTGATAANIFAQELPAEFNSHFRKFLSVVEQEGPVALRDDPNCRSLQRAGFGAVRKTPSRGKSGNRGQIPRAGSPSCLLLNGHIHPRGRAKVQWNSCTA